MYHAVEDGGEDGHERGVHEDRHQDGMCDLGRRIHHQDVGQHHHNVKHDGLHRTEPEEMRQLRVPHHTQEQDEEDDQRHERIAAVDHQEWHGQVMEDLKTGPLLEDEPPQHETIHPGNEVHRSSYSSPKRTWASFDCVCIFFSEHVWIVDASTRRLFRASIGDFPRVRERQLFVLPALPAIRTAACP